MLNEELGINSRMNSTTEEDFETQHTFSEFIQMEELFDKLKLMNYETDFTKQFKMRPINRHYFALQTNSGEQFFVFSSLAAWLIKKCEKHIFMPQESDDPNSTIAIILEAARDLGLPVDFSPNKLKQGYGKFVIFLLNQLAEKALQSSRFVYSKIVLPVEVEDEELIVEDDSELFLERIEEEMAAEELDSDDDEDMFLNVNDLNKKLDEVLQTDITNEEWQLEVERVLPNLKLTIKTDNRDWRGHVEQMKNYKTIIDDSMITVKSHLDKLVNGLSETMDKISSREKFLNTNLDSLLSEYRSVQDTFSKVNGRYRESNSTVVEKQHKLTKVSEELETLKQEMEERGTIMTDGTPLINIKKALVTLKEDVANMNVQIGILQHDIFHSKLRENLLMQQKLHSQVYA